MRKKLRRGQIIAQEADRVAKKIWAKMKLPFLSAEIAESCGELRDGSVMKGQTL